MDTTWRISLPDSMNGPRLRTIEPQYDAHFDEKPVILGPMTGGTWRHDPSRLGRLLAHNEFVARMFEGFNHVAEIGCSDGFAAPLVKRRVKHLDLYDMDPAWKDSAVESGCPFLVHNIIDGPLPVYRYDGIYALDVLEHIQPDQETKALENICDSLKADGVFIAGCPSLESQVYASELSRQGHVNCKSADRMRLDLKRYFKQVFRMSMNDCVLHTGFGPMSHYVLCVCVSPK